MHQHFDILNCFLIHVMVHESNLSYNGQHVMLFKKFIPFTISSGIFQSWSWVRHICLIFAESNQQINNNFSIKTCKCDLSSVTVRNQNKYIYIWSCRDGHFGCLCITIIIQKQKECLWTKKLTKHIKTWKPFHSFIESWKKLPSPAPST